MAVLILDPRLQERIRAERSDPEKFQYDEVWDEVLVVMPLPDNEHREIVAEIGFAASSILMDEDHVYPGVNVSDRNAGWLMNYREPDVAVYLASNPAEDCNTHYLGGPDLAVEIVSPGEDPHDKLDFYSKVNTRELLIVDREPWQLELYQLQGGKLILQGKADVANTMVLASGVLPLNGCTPRPVILVTHTATNQTWTA